MTLQQRLDEYKAKFESGGAPKAAIETMHRATKELRESRLAERALKAGDRAPAFTLNNQDGLGDRGLKVAGQFGLVFELPDYLKTLYTGFGIRLEEFNREDAYRLPMPARFVIDQGSVIRSADVNPDYTVRPDSSESIRVLEEMRKQRQ